MAREPAGPPGEPIDVVLINGRVFKPPSKYLGLDHRFVPLLAMIRVSLQRVGVNAETLNCSGTSNCVWPAIGGITTLSPSPRPGGHGVTGTRKNVENRGCERLAFGCDVVVSHTHTHEHTTIVITLFKASTRL